MRILKKGQTCFVVEKERDHFIIQQVLSAYLTTVGLLLSEVFSPVVSIEDLENAISKSNDVSYGLQVGIFTQNINAAFKAIN
ncbi:aldehyde dehydrogenase family protein [Bacillus velezensis]|uniref:aldehyde dehydrogenase family protein n=1 Tax=Bacillus velezensis TaxID=492670 RepID=UPI0021766221|nr:aldehyde dehydrogenase family protein [Bacillus velezensis]